MKNSRLARIRSTALRYLLLAAGTVIFTLPMIYMISTSLRPNGVLYEYPPRFFPRWEALTLENYDYILHQSKFYFNFLNSVVVSVSTVLLAAAIASAMAFVLGKFKSRATNLLFGFIIITMIIPGTTMIVPQFELATKLGLVNRLLGLIPFSVAWVLPFSTFMIKGFMENIPGEIMDAAWMDGAGVFGLQDCAAPGLSRDRIGQHIQFPDRLGGISLGQHGHQRQRPAHPAHRHRRLLRPASVHPMGLRLRDVRADPDPGRPDLHLLPEILCPGPDGRQREGMTEPAISGKAGADGLFSAGIRQAVSRLISSVKSGGLFVSALVLPAWRAWNKDMSI